MRNQYYGSYMGIPGIVRLYKKYHPPSVILESICQYFDVYADLLFSKTRKKEVVRARHFCMIMMIKYTRLSLENIGKLFNRHHTTVMSARETLYGYIDAKNGNSYKVDYDTIKSRLDAI